MTCISLQVTVLNAQQGNFHHYSAKDGMSFLIVNAIYQDKQGFIWSGGYGGLNKLDGRSVTKFGHQQGLSDYYVKDIVGDSRGNLWIATPEKLNKLNDGIFSIYKLPFNNITKLYCDSNNVLWVEAAKDAGYFFNEKFYSIENLKHLTINNFYQCKNNQIYICADEGLFQLTYSFKDGGITNIKISILMQGKVNDIGIYQNRIYLATINGLFTALDFVSPQNFELIESITNIKRLVLQKNGTLWIGTIKGLLSYQNGELMIEEVDLYTNSNQIVSLYVDNSDVLWVGTYYGMYRHRGSLFQIINEKQGLSNSSVFPISKDTNGNLWIGTLDGLNKHDGTDIERYEHPEFKGDMVNALFIDGTNLYCGTDQGLNIIRGGATSFISGTELKLGNDSVTAILLAHDKTLWVGGNKKITRIRGNDTSSFTFKAASDFDVWYLFEDKQRRLWAGGFPNMGVYCFEKDEWHEMSDKFELKEKTVLAIAEDKRGAILLATFEGVVMMYQNRIFRFDERNGLNSDFVYTMAVYDDELWVGTNQGLNKINLQAFYANNEIDITYYASEEGFSPLESNSYGIYKDADTMWFGTVNGLVRYVPQPEINKLQQNYTHVVNIKVNYHDTLIPRNAILDYKHNNISFEFIGIDYSNPFKVKYSYMLEGLQNKWSEVDNTNNASFTNLPAGKYTFKLRSRSNTGRWNPIPTTFSFEIKPPFWRTWWFITLATFLVMVTVYVLYRRRINGIRAQARLMQKITESELKALRSQINPHFIFNSLNSIQAFVLSNQKEEANRYLAQFARLIRQILNHSRSEFVSMQDELEMLNNYIAMESIRFSNRFTVNVKVDSDIITSKVMIPPMIIQPFVENAIIHGLSAKQGDGLLEINFLKEDHNYILVEIRDNGEGINFTKERISPSAHRSVGLAVTFERIESLNKAYPEPIKCEIVDLSRSPSAHGTLVRIEFPMHNEVNASI
ncbi:MAG: histidine kinase [Bacteroidetes bacterium]|nr:histidine kinase [Bacteroidota bacterium]